MTSRNFVAVSLHQVTARLSNHITCQTPGKAYPAARLRIVQWAPQPADRGAADRFEGSSLVAEEVDRARRILRARGRDGAADLREVQRVRHGAVPYEEDLRLAAAEWMGVNDGRGGRSAARAGAR